jgi:membrane associated rhomboid family serine protease
LQHREPIFNVPGVVLWLLAAMFAVHLLRSLLSPAEGFWLTEALAFVPGRLVGSARELPGGQVAIVSAFLTHLFVHGDLTHLLINSAWLLAFGTPVARRIDTARFLAFFFLCGIAGALLYLAVRVAGGDALIPVVGASGAISGLMGAAFRFLFRGIERSKGLRDIGSVPLMSLKETLRDRRVLLTAAVWTALNGLQAWGAVGLTAAAGIAWEAHLGGFYAGLLLYGSFEPCTNRGGPGSSRRLDDAADAC